MEFGFCQVLENYGYVLVTNQIKKSLFKININKFEWMKKVPYKDYKPVHGWEEFNKLITINLSLILKAIYFPFYYAFYNIVLIFQKQNFLYSFFLFIECF